MSEFPLNHDNGWFDSSGLLHVRPNEYSENGPLFTAEYNLLATLLEKGIMATQGIIKDGWFNPTPAHDNKPDCHFSHDNMTGLYVLMFLSGGRMSDLPVAKWNERIWGHPRDIAFYNLMKMNGEKLWLNLPLSLLALAVLLGAALVSCSAERGRTSGKMMWWLRWMTLSMHTSVIVSAFSKIAWKICEKLMQRNHPSPVMMDVSSIYFKEEGHPVKELMRKLYELK